MKKRLSVAAILALMACGETTSNKSTADHDHAAHASGEADHSEHQAKSKSPRTAAMANIGPAHVHIDYSSPSVRGRTIWGGLVPYGEVWVTGAHKATSINVPSDAMINGSNLPKGKYALFTIPGKDEWTIIFNKNWDQHLADDYDADQDVLRFQVKPQVLNDLQEELTYEVTSSGENKGQISISWDKLKVSFDVEIAS